MTYKETAKQLNVSLRIWKYGIKFLPQPLPGNRRKLFQVTPLDGWIFDPHKITEAFANDPDFSIKKENKTNEE